jgi:hypothetical protein
MKAKTLTERIKDVQDQANAFIDARVMEVAGECPGVPLPTLRAMIENRAPGCLCRQVVIAKDMGSE